MRFMHISDVHMGMEPDRSMPWSSLRKTEIIDTFYRAIAQCNHIKADILLIAGDLFHRQPLLKELKEVNYAFSKLNSTKVILMAGNHDYMGYESSYSRFQWNENVIMLKPVYNDSSENRFQIVELNTLGVHIYGFSYEQRDITEQRYNKIFPQDKNMINILLAHGGDKKNIPIDKKALSEAGFDYIALGHIHKPEQITQRMMYAGSLEPLDKTETGNHGFYIGEILKSESDIPLPISKIRVKFIPFAKRQYIDLEFLTSSHMTSLELSGMIKEKIQNLGKENIYKITLEGYYEAGNSYDIESFTKCGNIVQIIDNTMPDFDFKQLYNENRNNLIGMYIKAIQEKELSDELTQKALYYGIEALLKAGE